MLVEPPSKYTVGEILRLTEGSLAPVSCLDFEVNDCPRQAECLTLPIWKGLHKAVTDYHDGITLQDIIDESDSNGGDYCI